MSTDLEAFGERVRAIRTTRGISQEKLADLAGLDRTYVSGVERGRHNISLLNILRLARALDASPADFFPTQAKASKRK